MGFFSKSSGKNNIGEKDKWKEKYLNLVEAQENAEKAHKLNQELLCKTINRISIAASKFDPQIDSYLQRIRDHIKQGVDFIQLKAALENFTDAMNRLDERMPKTQTANNEAAYLFEFLLQRFNTDRQQQALNNLYKTVRPYDDNQYLFFEIAKIIDETPSNLIADYQDEKETGLQQPAMIQSSVGKQLIEMLEQIEIPEEYSDRVQALKQHLEEPEDALPHGRQWDGFITLLIEIYSKSQSKQKEIDKFLTHVTEQLIELGLTITDSSIALKDASTERIRLDQSVSDQMSDLQQRTSSATELEPLKQVISTHISKISKEIQENKQKEAIKRDKYQRQLEELSQKIKALECETGDLQSKLIIANTNAQRDVLTELPNRLAYDERLKMEISRWQRYHTPLCLVVWDIDYFKKINDSYGHQIGDNVLAHISKLFLNNIRKSDFIARFGGEEFIMLLPHTRRHEAIKVTDKLRNLVEQNQLEILNKPLSITISCGITQFLKGDTHETAFERADQALYQAKEKGRNRCCVG